MGEVGNGVVPLRARRQPIVPATPNQDFFTMWMHGPFDPRLSAADSDLERSLDDLEDLEEFEFDDDDDDLDALDALDDFGMLDQLERLGGFSESTSIEDPPLD